MYSTHKSRVCLLYKTVLRLHRGLPEELQVLGNSYVRDEFKRHKACNESESKVFMVEWTNYAVQLSQQLRLSVRGNAKDKIGKNFKPEDLDKFKDDQIVQLYELCKAAKEPEPDADESTSSDNNDETNVKK